MRKSTGIAVSDGAAAGDVYVYTRSDVSVGHKAASDPAEESARLKDALRQADTELARLGAQAEDAGDAEAAAVFEIHRMMLEDEDVLASLEDAIAAGASAEEAVARTEESFTALFSATGDDYMQARADDVRDICGRLIGLLTASAVPEIPDGTFILVADEILPSDLTRFGRERLQAVVTRRGSRTAHAAILLRTMKIPAVTGVDIDGVRTGSYAAVDATSGTVCFDAGENAAAQMLAHAEATRKSPLQREGQPFKLYLNIGSDRDIDAPTWEKCDGIGLFRTEYLYLGRPDLPTEEEQLRAYTAVLEAAHGKPVTVRTFDIGADKRPAALPLEHEENPALGCRGLRVYAVYPAVLRTQLRALLRAAVHGEMRIMYPMVTSRAEIEALKEQVAAVAEELEREGIPYRLPPQGAMIETPAAALLSEELAQAVDFFSVGTNDLTQYTLALDRQSAALDAYADPGHTAILRLIKVAADNAHKAGIPICVCGELAADPDLTEKWRELGIDALSVSSIG